MKRNINFLFWLGYIFLIISDMYLNVKVISNYLNYLELIGLFLIFVFCILKMSKDNINAKGFLIFISVVFVSLITYYNSRDYSMLRLALLIYAIKNDDFDSFLKKEVTFKTVFMALLVVLYFLNFTGGREFYRVDGTIRYTLGFIHPNALGLYTMMILFEFLYLFRDNSSMRKKILLIIVICLLFLNYFCDSRSSVISMILILFFMIFQKFIKKAFHSKISKFLCRNLFLLLTLLTLFLINQYTNNIPFAIKLNYLLTNRLSYSFYFLNLYPLRLFGNFIVGTSTIVLDNTYIELLLKFGVVSYIVYYYIFKKIMLKSQENNDYVLEVILVVLMIYGLMENSILRVGYNVFLLIISQYLFNKKTNH